MSQKISFEIGHYPDASICRVHDTYYMVCSSFQYFPALPIYQSADLIHWQQISFGLDQIHVNALLTQVASKHGIRYPALRHHQEKFYLIATHTEFNQHFVVSTTDPTGKWDAPIQIEGTGDRASLFFDHDNRAYCIFSAGTQAHLCEINLETGEHLSGMEIIWKADDGHFLHAPHLYRIDDNYVLLGTADQIGGERYVTLRTSGSLKGQYKPDRVQSPLLDQQTGMLIRVDGSIEFVDTTDGAEIVIYQPPLQEHKLQHLARRSVLSSLSGEFSIPATVPDNDHPEDDYRDDFVLPELQLHWQFVRNAPEVSDWSVEDRAGWLKLNGNAQTLSENAPLFVGRKQHFGRCKITTMVDFEPQRGQEEAGLAVYVDENHHYEIAITSLAETTRSIIVRRKIGSLAAVVAFENIAPKGLVALTIQTDGVDYSFSYQLMNEQPKQIARGETHYLASTVTGLESGVYLGVYATGNGRKSLTPAFFDWVEIIPETL